jgi:uncharacterized membrane protein
MERIFDKKIKRYRKRFYWALLILLLSSAAFVLYKTEAIPVFKSHSVVLSIAILIAFVSFTITVISAVMMAYFKLAEKSLRNDLNR